MFVSVFLASAFTLGQADTDVTQEFLKFAKSFCPGGNIENADIGNGNIYGTEAMKDFEFSESDREQYRGLIEELFGSPIDSLEGVLPGGKKAEGDQLEGCDEQHGNTCVHNAGQYSWCNYPSKKCMSKYASQVGVISYPTMQKTEGAPTIYTVYYDNALDQATTFKINKELSTSSQQFMSVTEKMSIGESLKITGGEPGLMSEEVSFSVNFDMEQTRSWTDTSTQKFTFESTIPVAAGSTTMAVLTISKSAYSGTWAAQVDLPYYAKLWCTDQTQGHYEWFVPAHYFMGNGPFHGSGTFTGGAGYDSHVSATKCPLNARTPAECNQGEILLKKPVKAIVA